jgi:hypothetical protein
MQLRQLNGKSSASSVQQIIADPQLAWCYLMQVLQGSLPVQQRLLLL